MNNQPQYQYNEGERRLRFLAARQADLGDRPQALKAFIQEERRYCSDCNIPGARSKFLLPAEKLLRDILSPSRPVPPYFPPNAPNAVPIVTPPTSPRLG